MIIRIVKMTFAPEKVNEFLEIFDVHKQLIRNFEGCTHLELLNDVTHPNIVFTYSYWQNQNALNVYRNSDLFIDVWNKTKILFIVKAEAWSVERRFLLD